MTFAQSKLFWIGKMMQAAPELMPYLEQLESAYLLAQSDYAADVNLSARLAESCLKELRPLVWKSVESNSALNYAWTMFHEEMMA